MNDARYFINETLLKKARVALKSDETNKYCTDEQIEKKEIIVALCLKYRFKYQFVNDIVFIYSIIDEWYFPYMKNNITLLHKNKLHTTKQYHVQKKFKNVAHVIQYIKKHDNFYYKPNENHKHDLIKKHILDPK